MPAQLDLSSLVDDATQPTHGSGVNLPPISYSLCF